MPPVMTRLCKQRRNVDIAVNIIGPAVQQQDRWTIALASFNVSDIRDPGIDLLQCVEGCVCPIPHHPVHLSS